MWWKWVFMVLLILLAIVILAHYLHFGVVVLHYHALNDKTGMEEIIAITPDDFNWHMAYLKKAGYTVVALEDAVHYLSNGGKLPKKAVAISFDDGYMDNYEKAFPILRKYNYPATVFIATGEIGGVNTWDLGKGYPELRLMDWEQVFTLEKQNIAVMPHTVHHVDLTKLTADKLVEEIHGSKETLEKRLGKPTPYFSYPYDKVNKTVVDEVVNAGFEAAFTGSFGTNVSGKTDLYRIKRMPVKEIHRGFWGRLLFVAELKLVSLFPW